MCLKDFSCHKENGPSLCGLVPGSRDTLSLETQNPKSAKAKAKVGPTNLALPPAAPLLLALNPSVNPARCADFPRRPP